MRTIIIIIVGIVALSVPWHNVAAQEWKQNTQILPQYCQDRAKGTNSPEWKKWRSTFGEAYIHMHHYCSGVYAEHKAKVAINQGEQKKWLGKVIHQMGYVGNHCNTSCVIYPELHTRLGWALGETGQFSEAIKQFQLAIRAKPTYSLAYARLSDLYIKYKQPGEARKILEEGLKAKPESRKLQRLLRELDTE